MARYGQGIKDKAVAQLLPPRSAAVEVVAPETVITTAAMNETGKSAWCREHGLYPVELDKWVSSTAAALAEPEELRASPQATRQDRLRIKELERDLLRKDRALAETAALLALLKNMPRRSSTRERPHDQPR